MLIDLKEKSKRTLNRWLWTSK